MRPRPRSFSTRRGGADKFRVSYANKRRVFGRREA
jgi:hypothetical protein